MIPIGEERNQHGATFSLVLSRYCIIFGFSFKFNQLERTLEKTIGIGLDGATIFDRRSTRADGIRHIYVIGQSEISVWTSPNQDFVGI